MVSFFHLSLTIAWVITASRWARQLDHSKKKAEVNHASATQSSRAGWRYREGNSSFSGPTPQSLGVCAAFFCDQARSNWDLMTSATQFHCPKLYKKILWTMVSWPRRAWIWHPLRCVPRAAILTRLIFLVQFSLFVVCVSLPARSSWWWCRSPWERGQGTRSFFRLTLTKTRSGRWKLVWRIK